MRTSGLEKKAFAEDARISEGTLSEVLNGVGPRNLAAEWLLDQTSDAFVLTFVDLWLESRGLKKANAQQKKRQAAVALMQTLWDLIEDSEQ